MLDATHEIPVKAFPHGMMIPWYDAVHQITVLSHKSPGAIADAYHKDKNSHKRICDRAASLPSAAAILLALAEVAKPGFIVPSRYGMRDGVLVDGLARLRL